MAVRFGVRWDGPLQPSCDGAGAEPGRDPGSQEDGPGGLREVGGSSPRQAEARSAILGRSCSCWGFMERTLGKREHFRQPNCRIPWNLPERDPDPPPHPSFPRLGFHLRGGEVRSPPQGGRLTPKTLSRVGSLGAGGSVHATQLGLPGCQSPPSASLVQFISPTDTRFIRRIIPGHFREKPGH